MTPSQKILIKKLLNGYFLRKMKRRQKEWYVLYDADINPIEKVNAATVDKIDRFIAPQIKIWKRSHRGNITLNLNMVRQLHGRHTIKQLYKQKDSLAINSSIYKTRQRRKKIKHDEKVNYLF